MKTLSFDEAKEKATKFSAQRERSPGEMIQKIRSWKLSLDEANIIVSYLKDESYINELRYANAFVNDKTRFSKWGRLRVGHYLKMSGIDEEYIRKAMGRIDEKEYFSMVEYEINKKAKQIKHDNKKTFRIALLRFSLSRGYEIEFVEQLIDKLF